MVIQRIQTLWLLCGVVCAALSLCMPWFSYADGNLPATASPVMLTLVALSLLLPLIGIFMFRNLSRQKQVATVAIIVAIAAALYPTGFCMANPEAGLTAAPGSWLTMGTAIFALLARRAMTRDERLLRSADRLR
jgi:glycerol-3-phosphate acyltransferase PlsY